MTVQRSGSTWVPQGMLRGRLTAADIAAALMGVFAALAVLSFMGALLTSGVAGLDIFEARKLEQLAASTVATAIVLVLAAFFCGGWAYGALRGRQIRGTLGDGRYGEPDVPARWVGAKDQKEYDDGRFHEVGGPLGSAQRQGQAGVGESH